ncbi:DUF423 domain-containing protein [Saccharibacillus sp. CPCC 101409]|uniref:DUF423 domain-containing protein n=1 Tax=Saccharibacillus sp. CPCC 101409 TaxID=3058041 RepID=UPI002671A1BD|nr:DUF423 domain-containing protein [Saccharibacillus sp. CPCC 101409]MDO3408824.1 DUF423 domain-containing protein [Saccharibacillus sp. CPCC 101409]
MQKKIAIAACLTAMVGVALGAFGSHILGGRIGEDSLKTFQTGIQYHFVHALAMLAAAVAMGVWGESRRLAWAGWLFFAGIVMFSGSLYLLSTTGLKIFGPITPLGGLAFIAGWILLALGIGSARLR